MSDPVNDKNNPTFSQPSSPQDQENPFITPLTFQVHPSVLPFNLNSVSPIKKNLRDATKPQKGKAQSSSSRKATTSKIQKVPKSQSKRKSKKQTAKEANDVASARKAPVYWEDEKTSKGESAMNVLMNWITTYVNWSRYKSLVKSRRVEEIVDYLAQHGKISELEKKFISASQWLDGTGKGVMNDIEAEKKKEGWSDDNPEYLERKKSLIEDYIIKHQCNYYYQLEQIMDTRDKASQLDGASSAAPKSSRVAEIMEPTSQNNNDHSQASNEEYLVDQAQINPFEDDCNNQIQLLAQPDNKTKSAITRLEDVFIKSKLKNTAMKDIMKDLTGVLMPKNNSKSLLTKDEQVEQAQVAAKLKKCQLEAAELYVQKTKRSMDLEWAIAKGQFISQLMKDNNIAYEQAKVILEPNFHNLSSQMDDHMDDCPPDPDQINDLTPQDNESMNKDVAVASDLTGQSRMLTLTPRPPSGLQKTTISQEVLVGTISATSTPVEKSRKRTRTAAPTPSTLDEVDKITGTPRLVRMTKLFPGGSDFATKPIKVLIERLIEVSKATLIPKSKASKSVKVDVDSAADILLLAGLIQEQASINEARRVVFEPGQHTAPTPSSSSAAAIAQFEFRNNSLSDKVDAMTKQLAQLISAAKLPQQQGQKRPQQPVMNSYALAASKHAPGTEPASQPKQQGQRAQHRTNPCPKAEHSVTLSQRDPANIAGAGKTISELIRQFNSLLVEKNIKHTLDNKSPIAVRNIHHHPSGDLVIYLESQKYAQALRKQADGWLPEISPNLTIKQEVHAVIVHGISTTFNTTREEDIELLKICNGDLLDEALFVRWLKKDTAEDSAKRFSSLLDGFKTLDQAMKTVQTGVWHGRGRCRTEIGGPPLAQCYNCQAAGHTASACKLEPMCPSCSGAHHAHNCPIKGTTALKCTACARGKLKADPSTNLPRLFKENHADFLHHPFAPTCPMRIANQRPPHNHSSSPYIMVIDQTEPPPSSNQC
ncbi:hypothetical protein DFH28DRAFT_947898 [Melampsora americana]|nr:hypothetical protein DFH28DRAFT_947898 [Melampsora americana]